MLSLSMYVQCIYIYIVNSYLYIGLGQSTQLGGGLKLNQNTGGGGLAFSAAGGTGAGLQLGGGGLHVGAATGTGAAPQLGGGGLQLGATQAASIGTTHSSGLF